MISTVPSHRQHPAEDRVVVGLIPAGGQASRLQPLPCSKELYPIGFHRLDPHDPGSVRPKPVCLYLLERMRVAGIAQAFFVVGDNKWDIAAYLGDGKASDVALAYISVHDSRHTPETIDQAFPFVQDHIVALGFPDIMFEPAHAYRQLISKQVASGADVVLGLFPTNRPDKVDMVEREPNGRVRNIVIKSVTASLQEAWIIAVWTPEFTAFLHAFVEKSRVPDGRLHVRELFVGDVVLAAVAEGLHVDSVSFPDGAFRDVGTPDDLVAAIAESTTDI